MACAFAYVIFLYRNFKDTDIDYSMYCTNPQSGDFSVAILVVPSEALLHRSKLSPHKRANNNLFPQKMQIIQAYLIFLRQNLAYLINF